LRWIADLDSENVGTRDRLVKLEEVHLPILCPIRI
jgi:hypothetical protein